MWPPGRTSLLLLLLLLATSYSLGAALQSRQHVPQVPLGCRNDLLTPWLCPDGPCPVHDDALQRLQRLLAQQVVGQEEAQTELLRLIASNASLSSQRSGALVIHLAGPTGVGKTKTAWLLGQAMFRNTDRVLGEPMGWLRFSGEHYASGDADAGAADLRRKVAQALAQCPRSVIVVDEVQLMQTSVAQSLFSAFDDTVPTFSHGDTVVSARDAVFILISDLGKSALLSSRDTTPRDELEQAIQDEMWRVWGQEKRLGLVHVIPMRPLSTLHLRQVARLELQRYAEVLTERSAVASLSWSDAVEAWIAEHSDRMYPDLGARKISHIVDELIIGPLVVDMQRGIVLFSTEVRVSMPWLKQDATPQRSYLGTCDVVDSPRAASSSSSSTSDASWISWGADVAHTATELLDAPLVKAKTWVQRMERLLRHDPDLDEFPAMH